MENIKTYSNVIIISDFFERYEFLRVGQKVSEITFASQRYLNQYLYKSREWRDFRRNIIIRDNGCDLAHSDRPINGIIIIHHINPLTIDDIRLKRDCIFDPENVICCSLMTHNAIHYGDSSLLIPDYQPRKPGDTCLWR